MRPYNRVILKHAAFVCGNKLGASSKILSDDRIASLTITSVGYSDVT